MSRLPLALALCLLALGCPKPKPAPAPTPTNAPPNKPPILAVVTDEADRHNLRLATFGLFFSTAMESYFQAYQRFPTGLPEAIGSGFLWLLPTAPPPVRYAFIENIGPDSEPYWPTIAFTFTPEVCQLGFFRMPSGQPIENPTGEQPMRLLQVAAGPTPATLEREAADPLPEDWAALVTDPATTPQKRLDILRRRSTDPAQRLGIHIYDTIDNLPDRFTNTQGRLPSNFVDLIGGNWIVTSEFLAMSNPPTDGRAITAEVTLTFSPTAKAFVKEITIHDPTGLVITDRMAFVIDQESTDKPRRSPLLVILDDPAAIDALNLADAMTLTHLWVPSDLTLFQGSSAAVEDQAEKAPPTP